MYVFDLLVPVNVVKNQSVSELPLKPVSGTTKVHAVRGLGNGEVNVRDVSCYCDSCITGNPYITWTVASTTKILNTTQIGNSPSSSNVNESLINKSNIEMGNNHGYKIGDFVAAVSDEMWYLGKIVDEDETEFQVNFMESKKKKKKKKVHVNEIK